LSTNEPFIDPASPSRDSPQTSLRSVAVVTGLTLVQLLLQFALQIVLARQFGAAGEMDAYVAALAVPVVMATILSGSLGYVLVPVVAHELAAGETKKAAAIVSQFGLALAGLTLVIAGAMAFTAQPLARLLCPGFSEEQQLLTGQLLAVSAWLVFANSFVSYLNALSHCYRRFARPAVAGVLGTAATLAYVLWFQESHGIFAVAWGVVAGALVTVVLLAPLFVAKLWQAGANIWQPLEGTHQCVRLLTPLLLAAVYWRLDPLLDRWLGSELEAGSISHLGYAWRLINGLSLVGTSGLSIVAFPAIAAHAAAGRREVVSAELAHAVRFYLFLVVPVCVGVAMFAEPIVQLLFERGRFTAEDTRAVAVLVVLYVGVIFGVGISDLLARTFYALREMLVPVVVTTVVFTLAAGLKIATARQWGVEALVAVTSLYYLVTTVILAVILSRRLSLSMLAGTLGELVRSLLASLVACAAAAGVTRLNIPYDVLLAALVGAMVYLCAMLLMRDEFAMRFVRRFARQQEQGGE
jgi:putative peptidoglycan lipid II flippase